MNEQPLVGKLTDQEIVDRILAEFDARELDRPSDERLQSLHHQVRDGRPLDSIGEGLDTFLLNRTQAQIERAHRQIRAGLRSQTGGAGSGDRPPTPLRRE